MEIRQVEMSCGVMNVLCGIMSCLGSLYYDVLLHCRLAKEETIQQLQAARDSNLKAEKEVLAAECRAKSSEESLQQLQAEETSRRRKFALLHSTFAQEKEVILAKLRDSETEANSLREISQVQITFKSPR